MDNDEPYMAWTRSSTIESDLSKAFNQLNEAWVLLEHASVLANADYVGNAGIIDNLRGAVAVARSQAIWEQQKWQGFTEARKRAL